MKLTFRQEIPRWDEGLPLGNGALGALVWGRADTFRISLGRGDLWDLRRAESLSSPSFNYAEYVRLAKAGEAGKAAFDELFDAPYNLPYPTRIPAAALRVVRGGQIPAPSETSEFTLDTRRAEAEVRTPTGALRLFLGAGEKIGRMRAEGDFEISLLPPPYAGADAEYGEVNRHPLTSLGYPPCRIFGGAWGQGFEQRISDTEGYAAALAFAEREGRREYAFGVRPLNPGERGEDLAAELVGALETEYEEALAPHLLWWENYFSESGVCLPEEDGDLLAAARTQRIFSRLLFAQGLSAHDAARGMAGGRRRSAPLEGGLSSRPEPAIFLRFRFLVQPSRTGGECYTDFLLSLRDAARAHARGFFGADGYILPGVMDIAGRPMTGWGQYSLSPGNQPWNCLGLDERWRYTGEEGALRDAYEYLSGSGRALLSLLVPDKEGKLVFPVSTSPEFHDDTVRAFFRTQTNYDGAGLLYLFSRLADLSRLAAPEEEQEWRSVLDRLAPLSADETGFMLDKEERYSESHRHFSHLMGIYPYKIVPYRGEGAAAIDASIARLEQFGTGMWGGVQFLLGGGAVRPGEKRRRGALHAENFPRLLRLPQRLPPQRRFQKKRGGQFLPLPPLHAGSEYALFRRAGGKCCCNRSRAGCACSPPFPKAGRKRSPFPTCARTADFSSPPPWRRAECKNSPFTAPALQRSKRRRRRGRCARHFRRGKTG